MVTFGLFAARRSPISKRCAWKASHPRNIDPRAFEDRHLPAATNRSVGGANLIPVAVVRDITQAVPVAGSFVGPSDALIGMTVEVSVTG